ncbi:DUF1059 domain-containing protein [Methanoregula sp.]|jgi:predicted small metal-binding protein|uniref:DUF1059 domain-containing protein n=1 Tax=Methanoregula sp. TaxID=2052170 RepID=UPI003BB16B77
MVSFKCSEIGLDCQYEIMSERENDLRRKILDHIHDSHHEGACPPEVLMKIQTVIHQ